MTDSLLHFKDMAGGYGDTIIVSGMSGVVGHGEVLGVFGRNGVGKSTFSKLLTGALPLSTGSVILDKIDLSSSTSHVRRRQGMGYMPQTSMVFDNLTVRENLSLARSAGEDQFFLDAFPRLTERLDQPAGSMSGGERKMLSFVRTMLEGTSLIVLDEPSEGVQPENISKMQDCIDLRKRQGTAFVLIEQNMAMLTAISDSYIGIDSGRIVFEDDKDSASREDILSILTV